MTCSSLQLNRRVFLFVVDFDFEWCVVVIVSSCVLVDHFCFAVNISSRKITSGYHRIKGMC